MGFRLIAIAAAAMAAVLPSTARADCASSSEAKVDIAVSERPLVVTRSVGIRQLSQRSSDRSPGTEAFVDTLGLTTTEDPASYQATVRPEAYDAGGFCAFATSVTVSAEWRIKVEIAKEIPRPGCVFQTVLGHEAKHVKVSEEAMGTFKAMMEKSLGWVVRTGAWGASPEQASKAMEDRLEVALRKVGDEFEADLRARQMLIDTPEEYAKLPKICGTKDVAQVLRAAGLR